MGLAVGISSISCPGAEKHAITVDWPPSWIFTLPVRSHSLLVSLIGKLDPLCLDGAIGLYILDFSTAGFVAQYSHESQWKARPRKHRYSLRNFVDILSGSRDTCI